MKRINALSLPFINNFNITTHLCLRLTSCFVFHVCPPFKKIFFFPPLYATSPSQFIFLELITLNNRDESTNHGNFHYISLSSFPLLLLCSSALHVFSNTLKVCPAFKVRDHFEVHVKKKNRKH